MAVQFKKLKFLLLNDLKAQPTTGLAGLTALSMCISKERPVLRITPKSPKLSFFIQSYQVTYTGNMGLVPMEGCI